ncbi:MAG: GGDEF domain-containing protein [Halioglobus sp.]|nr:GGDEF domain-containing protein [Halioglobus sp.]
MTNDINRAPGQGEEIEGAPPVIPGAELAESRLTETLTINRYLYQQTQQLELMLLEAQGLQALFEILLVSMPRHFSFRTSELWLYDPDDVLSKVLVGAERYGTSLQLLSDVFPIQELYELEPDIALIDATDSRMFEILKSEHGVEYALLMPLTDSGRLIGSLHLGLPDDSLVLGEQEEHLFAHLAIILSSCFKAAVSRQQVSQLMLLDPLTEVSNPRGFGREIAREISRARRSSKPVTVLMMEIDDFDDLYQHYGVRRGQFVIRKVAERLTSNLRATDLLARLGQSTFAVLIPGGGQMVSQDIAERMRGDVEDFSIDDGRGAVLQVTLSVGLVTWEPQQFPAVDMPQLARQMETVGGKALDDAKARGGNCVAHSRLSTLVL